MASSGFQLTTFLYGLYAGRRKLPALPAPLQDRDPDTWALGKSAGPLTVSAHCNAVQVDGTTCGSASIALAKASDPEASEAKVLQAHGLSVTQADFAELQHAIKSRTNRRKWFFAWPKKYGTPPWGASREMRFAGHDYFDRMVVDTSLPQSTRILTHAARCALGGYPVLLFVGGDTSMGWDAGVPRHVVVLHSPPAPASLENDGQSETAESEIDSPGEPSQDVTSGYQGEDLELEMEAKLAELEEKISAKLKAAKSEVDGEEFNPEFLIYEPSRGKNHTVTLRAILDQAVPREAFGGWSHVMWAVMPEPDVSTVTPRQD